MEVLNSSDSSDTTLRNDEQHQLQQESEANNASQASTSTGTGALGIQGKEPSQHENVKIVQIQHACV